METKTEAKAAVLEVPAVNGEMVKNEDALPIGWVAPSWTKERRDLLRKAVCPPSASEVEFEFFLSWCKRTGLDPFIKQAYLIERWDTQTNTRKHEPMASEAGIAARVDTFQDFQGIRAAAVYAGDKFEIDETAQTITHVWSIEGRAKAGNKLLGAWAHLKRKGRTVPITWLPLAARIQRKKDGSPTKFWATMPEGQIVKCARAEQYRLGYANFFGGVYIPEEMSVEAEYTDVTPVEQGTSRTESVKAKVAAKAAEQRPAAPTEAPEARPTPPVNAAGPVVTFGPSKGKGISSLSAEEIANSIGLAQEKLNENPGAAWAAGLSGCLDHLLAEQQRRVDEIGGVS
jgi:phage recombination protein Bet